MDNYEALRAAASLTGGEVLTDARGLPDFFAAFEAPGLKTNGKAPGRMMMGKYEACERLGGLYSLPLEQPKTGLTFDAAVGLALAKGLGYHLMTIAEWALMVGSADAQAGGHVGTDAPGATGRGAWSYAHNLRWTGVWDAAGNVREWVSGYRTVNGEIQLIPENDAAGCEADELGAESTLWRAIDTAGNFVAPGAADTLKWRYQGGQIILGTTTEIVSASRTGRMESVSVAANVQQTALNLLGAYGLAPGEAGRITINTSGERLAAAGACYLDDTPGVRVICGAYARDSAPAEVGVRICYVEGVD